MNTEDSLNMVPTKLLEKKIITQAEYLFSDANLGQDKKLRGLMEEDASRQGNCSIIKLLSLAPRLNALVEDLAAREDKRSDREAAITKAFLRSARVARPRFLLRIEIFRQ